MTKLFKNSKQVLSIALAFAVLAVSLFTGVVINSDAACAGSTIYWSGNEGSETVDTINDTVNGATQAGTEADPIIIDNAEELYVLQKLVGAASNGLYYKVADGISKIVLQQQDKAAAILALNSAQAVREYFESNGSTLKKWAYAATDKTFQGHFDGNGVTIYGMYCPDTYGGLFSRGQGNVSLSNFAIKNSYRKTYKGGLILGDVSGSGARPTLDSVAIVNNCMIGWNDSSVAVANMSLIGSFNQNTPIFNGLLVYGNIARFEGPTGKTTAGYVAPLGLIGHYGAEPAATEAPWFTNSVILGVYPYGALGAYTDTKGTADTSDDVEVSATQDIGYSRCRARHFSGVYTDMPTENVAWKNSTVTYTAEQIAPITAAGITGSAAVTAMPKLDWEDVFFANAGMPELRALHNISDEAIATEDGHIENCADCTLVGVEMPHDFSNGACPACGATLGCDARIVIDWEYKDWGSGAADWYDKTVADNDETGDSWDTAIIIDNPAELAWVAGEGHSEAGKYYKIADGIKAFNMTPSLDLDGSLTPAEVEEALNTSCLGKTWWNKTFIGAGFDGNGVTIYGLQGDNTDYLGSGALFYKVKPGVTIKNLIIKNSFFQGDAAGAVFANVDGSEKTPITLENIVVTGSVMVSMRNNGAETYGGVLFGMSGNCPVYVNDCLVYNNIAKHLGSYTSGGNTKEGYDVKYGLFGCANKDGTNWTKIENSIILDCLPFSPSYSYANTAEITFNNVYTNMIGVEGVSTLVDGNPTADGSGYTVYTVEYALTQNDDGTFKVKAIRDKAGTVNKIEKSVPANSFAAVTADGIKGAAVELMPELDWENTWFAVEGDMPELRVAHSDLGNYTDNGNGTHSESCSCGIAGVGVAHTFDTNAADGVCTACGAGCEHPDEKIVWVSNNNGDCLTADTGHYQCTACGLNDSEQENPEFVAGHNFTAVNADPADCTKTGTIAHKHCDKCDKNYAANASNTAAFNTALETVVDPIKAHTPVKDGNGDIVYNMDATGHSKTCSVCSNVFDAEGHDGDYVYDVDGHTGSCKVCKMATSGKVAHTFVDGACTTCPYECPHDDANIIWVSNNDGDCLTADTGHYQCTACKLNDSEQENPEFVAGHNFKTVNAEAADCTKTGIIAHKHCDKCNKNYAANASNTAAFNTALETVVDPIKDHTPVKDDNGAIVYNMDATGHSKICAVCTNSFDLEGHIGDYVYDAEGHNGSCKVCKMATSGKVAHTFVDGACTTCPYECPHDDANIIWVSNYDGNCLTADTGHYQCTACGLNDTEQVNPEFVAKSHTFRDIAAEEGTCSYAGNKAYKVCINEGCNEYFAADETDVNSTNYIDWSDIETDIVPDNHNWNEVAEIPADCENTGTIAYKYCDYCDLFATGEGENAKEIKLTIDYDTLNKETEDELEAAWDKAYNEFVAANGEPDNQEEFEALNKIMNAVYDEIWTPVYRAAIVEAAKAEGVVFEIAALGHSTVKVAEVAATYDKEGRKAHYDCDRCSKVFSDAEGKNVVEEKDLVIAKLVKAEGGDTSPESPKTGENVAAVAAVAALMGAAFVLVRKSRKA